MQAITALDACFDALIAISGEVSRGLDDANLHGEVLRSIQRLCDDIDMTIQHIVHDIK